MTAGSPLMLHIILDPEALEALNGLLRDSGVLYENAQSQKQHEALKRASQAVREAFTTSQTLVALVRRSTATARSQP